MADTEATKRPWQVVSENQICGATEYIADLAYSDLPEETVKANAELIVRVVNGLTALLEIRQRHDEKARGINFDSCGCDYCRTVAEMNNE